MSTPNSPSQSDTLLIEVFTEELPPKSLRRLGDAFSDGIYSTLKAAGLLSQNSVATGYATPRRLAVQITNVLSQAPDYPVREKLLPISIAFDADGKPTAPLQKKLATLGYADIDLSTLEKSGEGKNEALYLNVIAKGAALEQSAQAALGQTLNKLPIAKMMHYQVLQKNGELADVEFARPAHRIIALHGKQILNISALGINAGNQTEGHRFLAPGVITIASADQYQSDLSNKAKVIPSFHQRRELIESALLKAAGDDLVLMPESLLDEVSALVEWPAIYECHFDPEFLEVPQECLILTMQTNQKYFALTDKQGKLRNRFLIVSNIETEQEAKKRKRAMEAEPLVYSLSTPVGRTNTHHIKSLNTPHYGPVSSKPNPVYTGTKVLGIGTMHKSNAVPVFSDEEAQDISRMRRG